MPTGKVEFIKDSLKSKFQHTEDLVFKENFTNEKYLEVLYIKTISDETLLHDNVLKPFFEIQGVESFLNYLQSHPKVSLYETEQKTIDEILRGVAILFYLDFVFLYDCKIDRNNAIQDTTVETTIQGPQAGFSESLPINLGLIRQRYPDTALTMESTTIGRISRTKVMILHDQRFADAQTLEKIRQFVNSIDIDMFQSPEQLLDIIKKKNRALIPVMLITERPDRVAVNLATGKIIIMLQGSPFAVVLPTVLKDLMSSMEDIYQTYWIAKFLQILRYTAFNFSLLLPGIYVAVTSYNPELFRMQLALSIAGSRTGVPYPSFIEVLLMLFMVELLTEASIRLPKAIGPTATTVGGLILGQAAAEAGLASNIIIVIVSFVAISNFVIPINTFSFTIRILKYFILLMATIFGLVGVVLGFFMILAYFVRLDSFGTPFFTLLQSKPNQK
ncbi:MULTISPECIES: spore germination protein [Bacillaceae]|uniref:spore germination protein n=1 Tax=Bacillaceae TaxID=186817 RepID=UPI002FFEC5A7